MSVYDGVTELAASTLLPIKFVLSNVSAIDALIFFLITIQRQVIERSNVQKARV